MKTIEVAPGKYISTDNIVSVDMNSFDKMSPRKRLDWNSRFKTKPKKIAAGFTLTIVTTDGTSHRLDEPHSAQAYEALFHTAG
jgi:hypothetical protein